MKNPRAILTVIVVAQFCCTSLWFAGNGIMPDLIKSFGLNEHALGHLTSAVQLGFITGTLCFAILAIADRYSPSRVFFVCALLGALFNLGLTWYANGFVSLLFFRFMTGFFLAGIYPVGMKIAADYFDKGLGKSLGFLVGALVLGTALPHLLKSIDTVLNWQSVIWTISLLALFGGIIMMGLVKDGPFHKKSGQIHLSAFISVFKNHGFRSAAFGYFGHMWELYAFWAFVPVILQNYQTNNPDVQLQIPVLSFAIIGVGGLACAGGGLLSQIVGVRRTAFFALMFSCICCLLSPFLFQTVNPWILITFLLFWGVVVIADSPMFSTLVAQNAQMELKGTALTIVNCIGFSITIISIQLLNWLVSISESPIIYSILAAGPMVGLILFYKNNPDRSFAKHT